MPITSKIKIDIAEITGNSSLLDSWALLHGLGMDTIQKFSKEEKAVEKKGKKLKAKLEEAEDKLESAEKGKKSSSMNTKADLIEVYEKEIEGIEKEIEVNDADSLSSMKKMVRSLFVAGWYKFTPSPEEIAEGEKPEDRKMTRDDLNTIDIITMKEIMSAVKGEDKESEDEKKR